MKTLQSSPTVEEIQESWISGHLYYHQSLDRAVQGFVHPLVAALCKDALIDAFFFVRYGLGGPHVRLRLRVRPDTREPVLEALERSARRFLQLEPSAASVDEEVIRRGNEHILASDPHETDDSVFPDNSFHVMPFRPEVQRYGGPSRFRMSLDFFTLSSVAVVELLARYGSAPRAVQLTHAFRLLLRQALGFAADEVELADLLRYGVDSWGENMPTIVAKGDKVAAARKDVFLQLFGEGLADVRSPHDGDGASASASHFLALGSRKLSAAIGTGDRVTRARVGGSQLHMTATRLGLGNAEEVYLSRLLTVTLRQLRDAGEQDFSWLAEATAREAAEEPGKALGELLAPALAALAEVPEMAAGQTD